MADDKTAYNKRYEERRKQRNDVLVKAWMSKELVDLLDKHRGNLGRATFLRDTLRDVLTWKEENGGQLDLLAVLGTPEANSNKEGRTEKGA